MSQDTRPVPTQKWSRAKMSVHNLNAAVAQLVERVHGGSKRPRPRHRNVTVNPE